MTPAFYTWTVDAIPVVTSADVPLDRYYKAGQRLDFRVHFSENVFVTGTLNCLLRLVHQPNYWTMAGGSGTSTLVFSYTVVSGDNDMDGIQLGATLQLNGGTIKDASNNADLTLNGVPSTSQVRVNTNTPTVVLTTILCRRLL